MARGTTPTRLAADPATTVPATADDLGERTVWVRRLWSDARSRTKCKVANLTDVQCESGEDQAFVPAAGLVLSARVPCDAFPYGELAHACESGTGPHQLRVSILRKDNDPLVFAWLRRVAASRQAESQAS